MTIVYVCFSVGLLVGVGVTVALRYEVAIVTICSLSVGSAVLQFVCRSYILPKAPGWAVFADLVWLALQISAIGYLLRAPRGFNQSFVLLSWSLPGAISAAICVVIMLRTQARDERLENPRQMRDLFAAGRGFGFEAMLNQVGSQTATGVLSSAKNSAAAEFRAAQLFFGPSMLIVAGLRPIFLRKPPKRRVLNTRILLYSLLFSSCLIMTAILYTLLIPVGLGNLLTGGSWSTVKPLLILVSADAAQGVFCSILFLSRRARGETVTSTRLLSVCITLLAILLTSISHDHAGAYEFAAALAWSSPIQVALWLISTAFADVRCAPMFSGEAKHETHFNLARSGEL